MYVLYDNSVASISFLPHHSQRGFMRSLMLFCSFLFLSLSIAFSQKADAVFINGKIWTVDKVKPSARAVAVSDGRIIAVGANAEIQQLADATTKVVDLQGKFMMPGFIDNHVDFMSGSFFLENIDLRTVKNETELAQTMKDYATKHPNQWITGGYWNEQLFTTQEYPGKELVDLFTENQGVFIVRYDGSIGLANSVALLMAGITKATPDPPGGSIEHDKHDGEPTGILKGTAMNLVSKLIPPTSENENYAAAQLGFAELKKNGITTIHDVSTGAALKTYQVLKAKGELTARVNARLPLGEYTNLTSAGIIFPFGDEWITIGTMNAQVDGSLGAETALMYEPYITNPASKGKASEIATDDRLETWAVAADKGLLQLSLDATGDNAIGIALDAYEKVARGNARRERRFRIDHASYVAEKDFARLYGLEVIAGVQPYNIISEGAQAEKALGAERCKNAFPLRSFIDKKIKFSFGSGWPVAPLNPLLGIYASVTRKLPDGAQAEGWHPEHKVSVKEAIEAYTLSNAYSTFEENEKGSISIGKFADFVVLSDDLITIDPAQIPTMSVVMTVVGGKVVYQKQ